MFSIVEHLRIGPGLLCTENVSFYGEFGWCWDRKIWICSSALVIVQTSGRWDRTGTVPSTVEHTEESLLRCALLSVPRQRWASTGIATPGICADGGCQEAGSSASYVFACSRKTGTSLVVWFLEPYLRASTYVVVVVVVTVTLNRPGLVAYW